MAWVETLPSGNFRGGYRDSAGRKRYTRPYDRKSDAKEAAMDAQVKAQRQADVKSGTQSARIKWGDWWETILPKRLRDDVNTGQTEMYIAKLYLMPYWGATSINKIDKDSVQDWVDSLVDGSAAEWKHPRAPEPAYVRRIYALFKASMAAAVPKVLNQSPCVDIDLPRIRKKQKQHMTVAESAQISERLRADYAAVVRFGLETGLRPSELCGLHIAQVDLNRRVVIVSDVLVNRKNVIRSYPKDDDSRLVPLTADAVTIIRPLIEARRDKRSCGLVHVDHSPCESGLVFMTERGKPMNSEQLGERIRYAARVHKVPRRMPYSTRRGFATRAAEGGIDAFALAEAMGHATLEQAQEYVQQTQVSLGRIRAALGDREPLAAIEENGARGAQHGAPPGRSTPDDVGIERGQDAV